jgi:hypothetical protein
MSVHPLQHHIDIYSRLQVMSTNGSGGATASLSAPQYVIDRFPIIVQLACIPSIFFASRRVLYVSSPGPALLRAEYDHAYSTGSNSLLRGTSMLNLTLIVGYRVQFHRQRSKVVPYGGMSG